MSRLEIERNKRSNEKLLDYRADINIVSDFVGDSILALKASNQKLHQHENSIRELKLQIDQIDADLEKLPKEDSSKIAHQLKDFRNDLIQFVGKEGRMQNEISSLEDKIKRLDSDRKELAKKETKVKALQLRESLARKASGEIEKIYERFAEDSRAAVEKLTIDEFKNFVFSSSEYTVSLSRDYELEVLDSNGNRALQRLSMGQSQCLSLAFITAISRVSEKNPPLVIDMPFGRLDETVHSIISARLPAITSQLILFLLPNTEWNDQTKKNLKMRSQFIYELQFDKGSRKTEIKKI
jgi:DNA sulfur modification protein DndD